ncbi:MAG: hypothetical protein WC777_05320 [Candidatus Gracilibacteria bacterium]|jgi:hypothetical protein
MPDTQSPNREIDPGTDEGIKESYGDFDYQRPPFPIPEERWHAEPAYAEIDERPMWRIEERIFQFAVDQIQLPPHLDEDHPLKESAIALKNAKRELDQSMDTMWEKSGKGVLKRIRDARIQMQATELLSVSPETIISIPQETQGYSKEEEDKDRGHHYTKKALYFQNLSCFLQLLSAYKKEEDPSFETGIEDLDEFIEWTEVIQLGHLYYAAVRSAVHTGGHKHNKAKRRRKDGQLTMNHIYSVCVDVINGYSLELEMEPDPEKRKAIFRNMKLGVTEAEGHDYAEDHRNLGIGFLKQKLAEKPTWDTGIQDRLTRKRYPSISGETNIMYRRKEEEGALILRGIQALTKPEDEKDHPGYLKRQMLPLPEEEREVTLRVKAADRLNNLHTLKIQKLQTQIRTVLETPDIIEMMEEIEEGKPIFIQRKNRLIEENLHWCKELLKEDSLESGDRESLEGVRALMLQKAA